MRKWLRRIRGAIGMGLTWAAGWAPIGAVVGVALHEVLPASPIGLASVVVLNATTFAALGLIGGTAFGAVLRLAEGHRRFHQLSLPRFASWGAVGGVLLGGMAVAAGLWGAGFGPLGTSMVGAATLLGGVSATGTLVLARRAHGRGLLDADTDLADVALTEAGRDQMLSGETMSNRNAPRQVASTVRRGIGAMPNDR
jgi:hypothetical protein